MLFRALAAQPHLSLPYPAARASCLDAMGEGPLGDAAFDEMVQRLTDDGLLTQRSAGGSPRKLRLTGLGLTMAKFAGPPSRAD
jgi:hypothetical protein